MEAAGLQRYWTLTLLTLSYLVGFFVLYYFISYLVGTFLPSYYISSIFLCVLGTILGSFFAVFWGSSSTSLNVINSGWRTWTFLAWFHKPRYGEVSWKLKKKSDEKCFHQKYLPPEKLAMETLPALPVTKISRKSASKGAYLQNIQKITCAS